MLVGCAWCIIWFGEVFLLFFTCVVSGGVLEMIAWIPTDNGRYIPKTLAKVVGYFVEYEQAKIRQRAAI